MKKLDTDRSKINIDAERGARFKSMNWSRGTFYMYYKEGALFVPDYQRSFVRTEKQQYALVRSVLDEVPIPPIIIDHKYTIGKNQIRIIDGQQRLTTMMNFLDRAQDNIEVIALRHIEQSTIPVIRIESYRDKGVDFDDQAYYHLFNQGGTPHEK